MGRLVDAWARGTHARPVSTQPWTVLHALRTVLRASTEYAVLGLLSAAERTRLLAAAETVLQSRTFAFMCVGVAPMRSHSHQARPAPAHPCPSARAVEHRECLAVLAEVNRILFHSAQAVAAAVAAGTEPGMDAADPWQPMVRVVVAAMDTVLRVNEAEAAQAFRVLRAALTELLRMAAASADVAAVARPLLGRALASSSTLDVRGLLVVAAAGVGGGWVGGLVTDRGARGYLGVLAHARWRPS